MASTATATKVSLNDLLAGLAAFGGAPPAAGLPQTDPTGGVQVLPSFQDPTTLRLPMQPGAADQTDPSALTPAPPPQTAPSPGLPQLAGPAPAMSPKALPQVPSPPTSSPAPGRSPGALPTPPVAPVHSWLVNALDKGVLGGGIAAHDAQVMHNANLAYQNQILSSLFSGGDQGLPQQGQGGAPGSAGTQSFGGTGAITNGQRRMLAASAFLNGKPEDAAKIMQMKAQQLDNGDIIDTDTGRVIGHGPKPVFQAHRFLDQGDPGNTNQFFGEPPAPGAEPIYDGKGNPAGWKMADGSVQAITQGAGAKAAGEAATTFTDVPLGDSGSSQKLPTLEAIRRLGGPPGPTVPGAGVPQLGAPGAPAATPNAPNAPQFGVSQSPAAKTLADKRAETQSKLEADKKGAFAAMKQVDDQTNMISQNLHDMLGETQNPNTGKWEVTKPSMVNGWSTGSTAHLTSAAPFVSQPFHNLSAKAETVRSGTSFNSLQAIKSALEASGNGSGASVRMTDQISRMLGELNGSLDQDQSPQQFEDTVRRHLAQLETLNKARHDLFDAQYKDIQVPAPGNAGPQSTDYPAKKPGAQSAAPPGTLAERQAEARRRGLIK